MAFTTYDLNKQIIAQMEPDLEGTKNIIGDFVKKTKNRFYMLLCREIQYYTIFERGSKNSPAPEDEIISCLEDLGEVITAEETEHGVVECWVKDEENEVSMVALFPYDQGVVPCK